MASLLNGRKRDPEKVTSSIAYVIGDRGKILFTNWIKLLSVPLPSPPPTTELPYYAIQIRLQMGLKIRRRPFDPEIKSHFIFVSFHVIEGPPPLRPFPFVRITQSVFHIGRRNGFVCWRNQNVTRTNKDYDARHKRLFRVSWSSWTLFFLFRPKRGS